MFRAFLLKEELRLLYALENPTLSPGAPRRLTGLVIRIARRLLEQLAW